MKITILLFLVTSFTKIESKISIYIASDSVTYSGEEVNNNVTQTELNNFLGSNYMTDLAQKVMSVKSATVKSVHETPVLLLTQDFDNLSNLTIKVNAGISYTVQNTLTSSWIKTDESFQSQDVEIDVSWYAVIAAGDSHSHTTTVGKNEEMTEYITIGSTTLVELKPEERARAELSATKGYIEIEVIYKTFYRGYVKYLSQISPHHDNYVNNSNNVETIVPLSMYVTEPIEVALAKAHIINEKTSSQTIKLSFNTDGKVTIRNLVENNSTTAATLV